MFLDVRATGVPKTPARSGLMRSGAARSGYPVLQGARVPLYALSNVMRSGAGRSNYVSPRGFVALGGVHIGSAPASPTAKIVGDITITDILNDTPNRMTFRVRGLVPHIGQDVILTLGSKNNMARLFAGQVLSLEHGYTGTPANFHYDVSATDWTWSLNQRTVCQRWTATSATDIARAIVAAGAPNYTTTHVAAGLPVLDEFTVTNQTVSSALTQLVKRIGGYWYVDDYRDVHVFVTERAGTPPTDLTPVHASLDALVVSNDGGQLLTRVYVEGGGSTSLTEIRPGETKIPIATAAWYDPAGGSVLSGPQRLAYTGRVVGGGGSLVGPGAAPSASPKVTLAPGAGIESGLHDYAVTFVTATGESLAGPRVAVTCGAVPPPPTAPSAGTPTIGPGPDPGAHLYAVTNVTATGETVPGPTLSVQTGATPPPASAPTPTVSAGGGVDAGTHDYAATFVTAAGETTPGPISGAVTTAGIPNAAPVAILSNGPNSTPNPMTVGQSYQYAATHSLAASQSDHSQETTIVGNESALVQVVAMGTLVANAPKVGIVSNGPNSSTSQLTVGQAYDYAATFSIATSATDHTKETTVGNDQVSTLVNATPSTVGGGSVASAIVVQVPYANDPSVKWVHLYRRNQTTQPANVSSFRLETSIANVVGGGSTQYSSVTADSAIASKPAPPPNNTAISDTGSAITVAVPYAVAATVTWVHLWRRNWSTQPHDIGSFRLHSSYANAAGGGAFQVVDVTADTTIAARPSPPTANAAAQALVTLTGIPRGDGTVTARKLYRRSGGAGMRLLVTIGNNSTTTYTDSTANAALGAAPPTVSTATLCTIPLVDLPLPPVGGLMTGRKLYRSAANQAELKLLAALDTVATTYTDTTADSALGAAAPATGSAFANRVDVSGIPIGASTVTARKLYRTVSGGGALRLLATLADNTTTAYADAAADATLGATAPTQDLSGLTQPAGNVPAGSTTLIVAGAGAFETGGGWAVIGNGEQVIRYTGIAGGSLVGIPASGPGAIVASIAYNSTVTGAPMIVGVPASGDGAVVWPILRGDDVNLWIPVDDPDAQAMVRSLFSSAAGGSHSGLIEEVIQDRRLSITEARERGASFLDLRNEIQIRLRYTSHDVNSRAGRTVRARILVDPYTLDETFTIQQVTIDTFTPAINPIFHVDASTIKFTFGDLVRRLQQLPGD